MGSIVNEINLERRNSNIKNGGRVQFSTCQPMDRLRVLLLGSKDVGKTSIVRRFIRDRNITEYHSTETESQVLRSDKVIVELMDVNNFLLPILKKMAIKTADAFVLVYAVDDIDSFNFICNLREEIIKLKGKNTPIVVAGNKVDADRKIHPIVADCIVTMDHECPHVEVSAKEAFELTTLFKILFEHPSLHKKLDKLSSILQNTRTKSISDNTRFSTEVSLSSPPVYSMAPSRRCSVNGPLNRPRWSIAAPWRGMVKLFK